jgi:hypothetical protein
MVEVKAAVDLMCRRNQVRGNSSIVPLNRVATLIAKYQIEGIEFTKDLVIRLRTDKIDVSIQGFLKEQSPLG